MQLCATTAKEGHGRLTDWWLDDAKALCKQATQGSGPFWVALRHPSSCLGDEDGREGPRDAVGDSSAPVNICTRRDSIEFV